MAIWLRSSGIFISTAATLSLLTTAAFAAGGTVPAEAGKLPVDDQVTIVDNLGNETVIDGSLSRSGARSAAEPTLEGTADLSDLGHEAALDPEIPSDFLDALDPTTGEPFDVSSLPVDGGQVSPFTVIGGDGRYEVDATVTPYSRTAFVTYALGGENYVCTGFLVGNRILATAAHCLNDGSGTDGNTGNWGYNYKIWFGFTGISATASCGYNALAAPNGFTNGGGNSNWDWGLIVLNCNAGNVFGAFRPVVQGDTPLYTWSVTGFPGDKAAQQGHYSMYSMAGPINGETTYRWNYSMDTYGGQSGGPIWGDSNPGCPGYCAIGIHTTGGLINNFGSRITNTVLGAIDAYKTAYP